MLRCDQLLTIAIRTLQRMNLQFADHAVRVAYGLMRILDGEPGFSQEEVDRLACTALFHDIGLLHDDEDADLLQRESAAEWAHPRYAYVYLKRLGPFPQEAAIIRYHHSGSLEIEDSGLPDHLKLAANYLLALDTFDLFRVNDPSLTLEEAAGLLEELEPERYDRRAVEAVVDLAHAASGNPWTQEQVWEKLLGRLGEMPLTSGQLGDLFHVLMSAIDFRNHFTVAHSFVAEHVSDLLAGWCGLDSAGREDVHLGSVLHDLGKAAIPARILDGPHPLPAKDWEIMKSHVVLTGEILHGCVSEAVYRIAVRYHESWDGQGYPLGLGKADLTLPECIVHAADIFSALSEARSYKPPYPLTEVVEILQGLNAQGKLHPQVAVAILAHQEELYAQVQQVTTQAWQIHEEISREFLTMARGTVRRLYFAV